VSHTHRRLTGEPRNIRRSGLNALNETNRRFMTKSTAQKSPVRNGLKDISANDFWKDPLLPVEALEQKLAGIPVDTKAYPILSEEIHLFKELLRAYATRRYGAISLLAMIDVFQAVHYFLVLGDFNPDSRDHGYDDDAEVVHRVFLKHEIELRAFKEWLRAQH
jgi:hypothetical protein